MIDFEETWLPQILRYCEFIVTEEAVRKAWIEHDHSHTSVVNYDELYEQLFDDLDSDSFLTYLHKFLPSLSMQKVISDFLLSIKAVDVELQSILDWKDYERLFVSQQWRAVRNAAQKVIREFRQ